MKLKFSKTPPATHLLLKPIRVMDDVDNLSLKMLLKC